MKNRLYILIRLCLMVALFGVTGQVYAEDTQPRLIVNDLTNGSATWYQAINKSGGKITSVPYSAAEQTLYIDIQPDEGYWTSADELKGKVEKYISPSGADSRTRSTSISIAQYAVETVSGQTYAANGAGMYQVTIPGMVSEDDAAKITKFVLTANFVECTSISGDPTAGTGISATADETTYNGQNQTAVIKLGDIELKKGVDYTVDAGSSDTYKNAGSYPIAITGMGKYKGTATPKFVINPKAVGLTWTNNTPYTFNGSAQAPTVAVKNGDLFTGDACKVTVVISAESGSSLTEDGDAVNVGNYTATATELSNANYKLSDDAETTAGFEIAQNSSDEVVVTIVGNSETAIYDGNEHTASGYEVTNISNSLYTKNDFTISSTATASATRKDVGTTEMGLTGESFINNNSNFSKVTFDVTDGFVTITPKGVNPNPGDGEGEVSIEVDPTSFIYDGTDQKPTITVKDGKDENAPVIDASEYDVSYKNSKGEAVTETKDADTYTVVIQNKEGGNYVVSGSSTFTITPKPVNLAWSTPTTFTYDGQPHKLTASVAEGSLCGSDACEVKVVISAKSGSCLTEDGNAVNVGNYTATATELSNANYALPTSDSERSKDFEIQQNTSDEVVVTIVGKNETVVYDGNEHTVSGYDVTSISSSLYTADDFTYNGTAEPSASRTNAGKTEMGLTGESFTNNNTNFSKVTFDVTDGFVTITPKGVNPNPGDGEGKISITVSPATAEYDGTDKKSAISVTVKDGEGDAAVTIAPNEYDIVYKKGENEVSSLIDVAEYTVVIQNKEGGNYDVSGLSTFTITPKEVGLTWDKTSFVYTGHSQQPTATVTGVVKRNGVDESCTVKTYSLDAKSGSNLTDDKAVNVGSYTATATELDNANYKLPSNASQDFSITKDSSNPVVVTIVGTQNTAVYDGKEHSVKGYEVTNISNSLYKESDFIFSGTAEAKRTEKGQTNMGLAPEQFTNTNDNFEVTFTVTDGSQTILKKVVKSTVTVKTKTYDGNTDAQVSVTAETGVTGESLTITGVTGTFEDANVGIDKTVTLNTKDAVVTAGNDKTKETNYEVIYPETATGTITSLDDGNFSVSFDSNTDDDFYIYNGQEKKPGVTVKDGDKELVKDQDYTVSYSNNVNAGENTASVNVKGIGNYDGSLASKNFSIYPKTIGIDWSDTEVDYDGKSHLPTAEANGLCGDDECTITVGDDQQTKVGNFTATATGLSNANYALPEDASTNWYIVRVIEPFAKGCEWATFVAEEDLQLSTGLQAFAVTGVSSSMVNTEEIVFIPANVGILLKRSDKTVETYRCRAYDGEEKAPVSKLIGSATESLAMESYKDYVLYNDQFSLSGISTVGAGHAYLPYGVVGAAGARSLTINCNGSATGIDSVGCKSDGTNERWHNLDGRMLQGKPTKKGLYIKDGRKVVIK